MRTMAWMPRHGVLIRLPQYPRRMTQLGEITQARSLAKPNSRTRAFEKFILSGWVDVDRVWA
jgi:hypothetical protein